MVDLLKAMLRISIENAGAQLGSLFLYRENTPFHVANGFSDAPVKMFDWIEVDQSEGYAKSVIHFVERTGKHVVVKDGTLDNRFAHDSHILTNKVKSILCTPILQQGKPVGIFYLENNIVSGCFSPDRIELLQLLSGNMAISLNNAILFDNLDHKVQERTKELQIERNKLKVRNQEMEQDIALARETQFNLIPSENPTPYISSMYKPMEQVGGDFYDFITFPDSENIGIFLSDVSGHGVTAAFITSMVKTIILQAGSRLKDPAEFMHYFNEVIQNQTSGNFITVFYAVYNPKKNTLQYCNAGHNPPFVVTNDNIKLLEEGKSMAIAVLPNKKLKRMGKQYINAEESLTKGSKLLLYTDGMTEAYSPKKKCDFEESLMEEVIFKNYKKPAEKFLKNFFDDLVKFRGSDSFDDDICMVCLDVE